jgi:hypothetical protein
MRHSFTSRYRYTCSTGFELIHVVHIRKDIKTNAIALIDRRYANSFSKISVHQGALNLCNKKKPVS